MCLGVIRLLRFVIAEFYAENLALRANDFSFPCADKRKSRHHQQW